MNDDQLHYMAEIAFDVLNWAQGMGMKKEQQIEQVVAVFKSDYDVMVAVGRLDDTIK